METISEPDVDTAAPDKRITGCCNRVRHPGSNSDSRCSSMDIFQNTSSGMAPHKCNPSGTNSGVKA